VQKSAEEKKKDKGMTESMVTKIVDNLQIRLEDLHVRIEHQDTIATENSFSLGISLQEIDLYTTDKNWARMYLDRTKEANRALAMNKVLKIKNFGVYYKTSERSLISQVSDDDKSNILQTYSSYDDATGRIHKHVEDYLVAPIRLEIKLTQNDPEVALANRQNLMNLLVSLDQFCITVQKGQYDNVQMLLELTSEYMRFLGEESLRTRKKNLSDMNALFKSKGLQVTKNKVRDHFCRIYKNQLDIILAADPKKPEKLKAALVADLRNSG